ncbi:MAG: NYN domain-containing protein [Chloroflexota bacterium]
MPYLIDGHNLVPKIPGLSLRDIDDEQQLIEMLQEFCRVTRRPVEVFFDKAPAGQARQRSYGLLTARFVPQATIADEAIRRRLVDLGKGAKNWTVVSSDGRVQSEARAVRAQVLSSEAFAKELSKALAQAGRSPGPSTPDLLSSGEVDEWLKIFKHRP